MSEFDHMTLSAYLDGELDNLTMRDVKAYIDRDADARRYVLDALHATMLLRTAGRDALDESIPIHLEASILKSTRDPAARRKAWWPSFRPVLAFATLLLGIGLGIVFRPVGSSTPPSSFPALPEAYLEAVNESLENNISGVPFVFETADNTQRIVVTPIRTYRNRHGQYYRDYRLELHTDQNQKVIKGLAVRSGNKQWETKIIQYNPKAKRL